MLYSAQLDSDGLRTLAPMSTVGSWRRKAFTIGLSAILLLVATVVVAVLLDIAGGAPIAEYQSLAQQDPKQEGSKKLYEWWSEVNDMQSEVEQFEKEANDKSVQELVHLARVKDLLQELQKDVPKYTPPTPTITWSYGGLSGPSHWGNLSSDFATCSAGRSQSPINIELNLQAADLPALGWQFPAPSPLRIKPYKGNSSLGGREFYDGHTFEVEDLGGPMMTVGGIDFLLEEFHFHTPSEHAVAGRYYDAEIQFVHVQPAKTEMLGSSQQSDAPSDDNRPRLVVSAFFQQGERSPAFIEDLVLNAVPKATANPEEFVDLQFESIAQSILVGSVPSRPEAAREFVPNFKNYFQYVGSMSTPPCTEGVTWIVLKNAISLSEAHLAVLAGLEGINARPLQPLNGRQVLDVGDESL